MRVVVAPNAFKGSLGALKVAKAMASGVRERFPAASITLLPVSDGGDGLIDAFVAAKAAKKDWAWVRGPLGRPRKATFAWADANTAVIEMAQASGIGFLKPAQRDPMRASSYGTGELIAAAVLKGAKTVIVGLGGSATNDGGAGMAQALGAELLDQKGHAIATGISPLLTLSQIKIGRLKKKMAGVRVIGVCDVDNPLLGLRGSARVFGPQKGADASQVRLIDQALSRYASVIARDLGKNIRRVSGAGAAGGLGAGLLAFLDARLVAGSSWVLRELSAGKKIREADWMMSGEGQIDRTSFYGKAPIELARLAHRYGISSALICGSCEPAARGRLGRLGASVVTLEETGAGSKDAFSKAAYWIKKASVAAAKQIETERKGKKMKERKVVTSFCSFLLFPFLSVSLVSSPFLSAYAADRADLEAVDHLYFHRDQGNNLDLCLQKLHSMLAADPKDGELLWREGRGLVRRGEQKTETKAKLADFTQAMHDLKAAEQSVPGNADVHFWTGVAMGRLGETRGVIHSLFLVSPIREEMGQVLKIDPSYGGAYRVLGEIYQQLPFFAGGDQKKALEDFEKAVALEPNYTSNYIPLAKTYKAAGQKGKAIAALKAMLAVKDPADPADFSSDAADARKLLKDLGDTP